jgi:hypothetical protein
MDRDFNHLTPDQIREEAKKIFNLRDSDHIRTINHEFSYENECMMRNCQEKCKKRVLFFLVWARTVFVLDICDTHTKIYPDVSHGEMLYIKDNYTPQSIKK